MSNGKSQLKENKSNSEVISRLHIAYAIAEKRGSLNDLGAKLSVAGSVISGWRSRGIPDDKISRARIDTDYLEKWLKTGKGEMRTNASADPIEAMVIEKLNGYTADKEIKDSKLIMHMLEWLAENRPDKFEYLCDNIKSTFIAEHK